MRTSVQVPTLKDTTIPYRIPRWMPQFLVNRLEIGVYGVEWVNWGYEGRVSFPNQKGWGSRFRLSASMLSPPKLYIGNEFIEDKRLQRVIRSRCGDALIRKELLKPYGYNQLGGRFPYYITGPARKASRVQIPFPFLDYQAFEVQRFWDKKHPSYLGTICRSSDKCERIIATYSSARRRYLACPVESSHIFEEDFSTEVYLLFEKTYHKNLLREIAFQVEEEED